jgi:hypothetical protein
VRTMRSLDRARAVLISLHIVRRWNFTPSPGWTKEEAQVLNLCLMKHGVGQWMQIINTGLLPGKLIQQLNGQTQRLLGQQSLAGEDPAHHDCHDGAAEHCHDHVEAHQPGASIVERRLHGAEGGHRSDPG